MTDKYDGIKAEFIKFLANPNRDKSQRDWAKEKGVDKSTLSEWKKQGWFKEALVKEVESVLGDDLPEIYAALKAKAKKGDIAAISLYLKQAELLKADKTETINKLNLDFLRPLIEETQKEVDEERQKQIKEIEGSEG